MGASLSVDVIPTGEIGILLDMISTGGVITGPGSDVISTD